MATIITGDTGTVYELRDNGSVWITSKFGDIQVTSVSDPDDFATAVDNEEEDMRCMMADARAEFGV